MNFEKTCIFIFNEKLRHEFPMTMSYTDNLVFKLYVTCKRVSTVFPLHFNPSGHETCMLFIL